jgi:hypothetical protein
LCLRSIDRASRPRTYGILQVDVVMVMVILLNKLQVRKSTSASTLQRSVNILPVVGWVSYYVLAIQLRRGGGMQQHKLPTVVPRHAQSSFLNPASCMHPLQARRGAEYHQHQQQDVTCPTTDRLWLCWLVSGCFYYVHILLRSTGYARPGTGSRICGTE